MTQRTLYKLIESIGAREFPSDEAMLQAILEAVVERGRIDVDGGRIWKLHPAERCYELIHEHGSIDRVGTGFRIALKGYALFDEVARKRTVLAEETDRTLRRKGIALFSATGIGDRVTISRTAYYEYLMAFNALRADEEFRHMLSIAGEAVTQLLARRRSEAEKQSLLSDLELARDLQRRILPEHRYAFGRYELYGVSVPEKTVGGDFFNYYPIPGENGRLAVAVGDAASKGFPAAVHALFVSGALMMSVEAESKISSMLRRINAINRRIFPHDRFLTLFYCDLFDTDDGLVLYANAGHCKPVHYRAADGSCTELAVTGPMIGLLPDSRYDIAAARLERGDALVIYTDGITEANNGDEEFEEQRLFASIRARSDASAKGLCLGILDDVQAFSAGGTHSDDKTVVVIRRMS